MASEYLKWLARNEKPEKKRELSPKEKRSNWWYYHKGHVALGLAAAALVVFAAWDLYSGSRNQPDYQVAYIGAVSLPEDTANALESALASLGEDLNGDGQVLVHVNQYLVNADDSVYMVSYGSKMQLMADMSEGDSFIFLMEDPAEFQSQYGYLAYPDGTFPAGAEEPSEDLWYSWADCPVLTGLSLGGYRLTGIDESIAGDSQELLSNLYIARRGFGEDSGVGDLEGYAALWQRLTEGAK